MTRYQADAGQLITFIMDWLQKENVGKRLVVSPSGSSSCCSSLDNMVEQPFTKCLHSLEAINKEMG